MYYSPVVSNNGVKKHSQIGFETLSLTTLLNNKQTWKDQRSK